MFKFIKNNSYDIFKMFLNQIGIALLALVMTIATHQNNQLFLIVSILCIIFYLWLLYTMTYEIGIHDKPKIDGGRAKLEPLRGLWLSLCANSVNIICGIMVAVFSLFIPMQSPVSVSDNNGEAVRLYSRSEVQPQIQSSDPETNSEKKYEYKEVQLFSDNPGVEAKTYEYDSSKSSEVIGSAQTPIYLYDENREEVEIFTDGGVRLSTVQRGVNNWASNLYSVPYAIVVFFQPMYAGVRSEIFANSEFFYLISPIPSIIVCAIAYYMGACGKRILFFIPERKRKPRK